MRGSPRRGNFHHRDAESSKFGMDFRFGFRVMVSAA